jgi:nicotinamidase-related amidase
MNPAIIVVDMVKDNLKPEYPISVQIRSILLSIQKLLKEAQDRAGQRGRNVPGRHLS